MYYVIKQFEISAAHQLTLDYESACTRLHGHNWRITVECRSEKLDANGMVVDFSKVKRMVIDRLDHRVLNEVLDFNPTAENIARWVVESVPHAFRARVEESEGNTAVYEI